MTSYKAHITKQRKLGTRDEANLKLFKLDGTPIELGGGDGGGRPIIGLTKSDFTITGVGTPIWFDWTSADQATHPADVSEHFTREQYGVRLADPHALYEVVFSLGLNALPSRQLTVVIQAGWDTWGLSALRIPPTTLWDGVITMKTGNRPSGETGDPDLVSARMTISGASPWPNVNVGTAALSVMKLS